MKRHLQRIFVSFTNWLSDKVSALGCNSFGFGDTQLRACDPLNKKLISLFFNQSRADSIFDGQQLERAIGLDIQERVGSLEGLLPDFLRVQVLVLEPPWPIACEA